MMKKVLLLACGFMFALCTMKAADTKNCWAIKEETDAMKNSNRYIVPDAYQTYTLDINKLKTSLENAPLEFTAAAKSDPVTIALPLADGSFVDFVMVASPIMEEDLSEKYPFIKTYSGIAIGEKPGWVRIDFTLFGFHAMMRYDGNDVFVDPYSMQTTTEYIVYNKKDFTARNKSISCSFNDADANSRSINSISAQTSNTENRSIAGTLRTYRLALACTGEYAAFYGGTTAGALSGMVTSVNRVTGVYETELDIRLNLIANTDTLIFLNAATDPYDNNDGATMLGQNQTTVTSRIGNANYDIGHVFSTGGGGIANLGCVCNASAKAQGVTGSPSPAGDPFDIDYVAHEMGHQFGGNHTFNSVTGSCGGGNRNAGTAYEPGSGVTIMAYAGICGSDNLANNSIACFHTKSFDEIVNYTTLSTGNSCPVQTPTGNNAPVMSPGVAYYVPVGTAFKLNGSGTDPDGDTLTYSWEEFDLGPSGTWNAPAANAPIYRSYVPSVSGLRYFPKLSVVMSGTNVQGESKTAYARTLHFRFIGRDNKANGGGVTYNDTLTTVSVIQTSAPFAITYPDTAGIVWNIGSTRTITWNVGGTDQAPFNEPLVNIYLSTNAGTSFPITLATGVANNGSYTITVPNNPSNTCRIWVEGASSGSIFFDINNKNFIISDFAVTYPNTSGITWNTGSSQTITWDVAGTAVAPFNYQNVRIFLSTDNGVSYSDTLALSVPNNGSYTIVTPNKPSNTCRIKVFSTLAVPSLLLDVNDTVFTINGFVGMAEENEAFHDIRILPNPASDHVQLYLGTLTGITTLKIVSVTGQVIQSLSYMKKASEVTRQFDLKNIAAGVYFIKIENTVGFYTKKLIVQ